MSTKKPIKILFLAADASANTRLRLDEESRAIDQALRQAEFRDKFDIRQHSSVRVSDLSGLLLRHQPDIVHFSSHGSEAGEIILEDSSGNSHPVTTEALSQLFSVLKDNVRCVVLNACYSEQQAQTIAQHIDYVIGMVGTIGDATSISFTTAFYQALGYGRDVKTAFELGCVQINLENLGEQNAPKLLTKKSNQNQGGFISNDESLKENLIPAPPITFNQGEVSLLANEIGTEQGTSVISYLPPKTYHRLIGRFDKLDEVMTALREPVRKPIIAIIGLGGIGKTALAREAIDHCLQEDLFTHIVWVSFKTEHFIGESIIELDSPGYSFDELLNDIGRQCNQPGIVGMPPRQKQTAVEFELATKRILVVMDNLETISDNEKLVAAVFLILGKSKLLITSRHYIKNEYTFNLNLDGFREDESVTFLYENSKERGIEIIAQASRLQLVEIHQVTGGAPLAMKLVIGQMSRQPVAIVLDTLKQAAFKGQDYPFYRFLYQHAWNMLDTNTRKVLVDISVFPPITGGKVADVQAISQVELSAFWPAIDQLVTLSLVDKIGSASEERYALHPLTQYFIRSDITREWISQ